MSLVDEINKIVERRPLNPSLNENTSLVDDYQKLLDQGLIKRRGYTLQTIEEKQKDVFDLAYSTNK